MILAGPIRAQEAEGLGSSHLQELAQHALDRQAYGEAVPYLEELDRRLRESTDSTAVRSRETILFYLGLGRLQSADLTGAARAFAEFVTAYPAAPNRALARLYWGDALYYQGRLPEAHVVYEELRASQDPAVLGHELEAVYWEHLGDCLYADQAWETGSPVFNALRDSALRLTDARARDEKLAKAGSYLLQAAIALNDFGQAMAALPVMSNRRGGARHELALNLALLRGGDQLYDAQRYGEALYFYERVLPPDELTAFWQAEVSRLTQALTEAEGVEWLAERINTIQNDLAIARAKQTQVENILGASVPDYSAPLAFRVARCYLARGRVHEAYWAFVQLEQEAPMEDRSGFAEEALYGQVKTAVMAGRDGRAQRVARRYLRTGEFKRFIGDVGYELLQTEVRAGDLEAIRELAEAFMQRVRLDPTLQDAPKLIYLVGSTLVELGEAEAMRERFAPMLAEYPQHGFSDGLSYWLGLADVLAGGYRPALAHLERVLALAPDGSYAEDARYREAVCWYGMLNYERARAKLEGFLADYPQSRVVSEVHALLGDLAAAEGRIDAAINAYAEAHDAGAQLTPPNMGYINHAVFQGGKLLANQERWAEMAEWFESYLGRWGRDGRAGDALYELGRAQVELGRTEAMLDTWIQAILRFGNDPGDTGPDLMLADYPGHYQSVRGDSAARVLRDALAIARAQEKDTLVLRLACTLREVDGEDSGLDRVTRDNIESASAAVLVRAAEQVAFRDPRLALEATEAALVRAPFSEFAERALVVKAEHHARAGEPMEAIAAWRRLAEQFPASGRAAEARLREGDLWREQGETAEAIAAYREVLQVREWRGPAWAEANYKVGLAHFEAGDFSAAFGFCQRVYVLYASVANWAAEAYLISGLALEQLGRAADAMATYRELLAQEEMQKSSAAEAASERLEALRAS